MRIRILKKFYYRDMDRMMEPGKVENIPDTDAEVWCKSGLAMKDKSLDVPIESKESAQPAPQATKNLPRRKRK